MTQILWEHLRGTHWGLDTEVRRNTQIQAYLQDVRWNLFQEVQFTFSYPRHFENGLKISGSEMFFFFMAVDLVTHPTLDRILYIKKK